MTYCRAGAAVEAAYERHGLLVFPGQHLSLEEQNDFSKRFGELVQDIGGIGREQYIVTNRRKGGELVAPEDNAWIGATGNESWHYDRTFLPVDNRCSTLAALVVPKSGGGTAFADMAAGYEAFDAATRARIEELSAYHSLFYSQAAIGEISICCSPACADPG